MIASAIALCMLGVQGISLIRNLEKGTILSIIFILIGPNFFNLSYEVPATFLLIFAWLIFDRKSLFINEKIIIVDFYLFAILFVSVIMTLISSFIYSIDFNYIGILGIVRLFGAMFLYRIFFRKNGLKKLIIIFSLVLIINAFACIIQFNFDGSVNLFYKLYWREGLTPLEEMVSIGKFSRPFGTFSTPLYLSIILLVCDALYFYLWLTEKKSLKWFIGFILSTVLSIFSYTKSVYFGYVFIILFIYIYVLFNKKFNNFFIKTSILILFSIVIMFLIIKLSFTNNTLNYYLSFFKNPLSIFETRYGEEGNLNDIIEIIKRNPFFGVGVSSIEGEFVGDSAYFDALHSTGIIGLFMYLAVPFYVLYRANKKKDILTVAFVLIYLLLGLAIPIFTNYIGSIILGYSLSQVIPKKNTCHVLNLDKKYTLLYNNINNNE